MRICFIVGDHYRHTYLYNQIACRFPVAAAVVVVREAAVPDSAVVPEDLAELHRLHFSKRVDAEIRHFGTDAPLWAHVPHIQVQMPDLNGDDAIRFLADQKPDLLITWGVPILGDRMLQEIPGEKWNIHGGLSPWYRGTATHFWPSYFLEPQMTGMTVHRISPQVDGGEIVHQCVAPMIVGDGLHDVACRAVAQIADELPALLERAVTDGLDQIATQRQTTGGRIWRTSDWRPAHLRLIYELFKDQIVDRYLEGHLGDRSPKLFRDNV